MFGHAGSVWVLWQFCDSEPLVCVFFLSLEQRGAAHNFTAMLNNVVLPRLAAVWLCIWKSSLFHLGPLRSDVLQTTKAIIADWLSLWYKPGCHGDLSGMMIMAELVEEAMLKRAQSMGVEPLFQWTKAGKQKHGQVYKQAPTALTATTHSISCW